MPAPTQNTSTYKRRVISAMLEGPAADAPPRGDAPRGILSREIVYWVFALAFISAAGVFFLLYTRDSSAITGAGVASISAPQNSNPASLPVVRSASPSPAEQTKPAAAPPLPTEDTSVKNVDSESLPFKITRSRVYQNVGPIGVRLLRVDLKRRTCDLSFRSKDHRYAQRRFQVNRALQVKVGRNATVVDVTVSSLARDSIVLALDEVRPGGSVALLSKRR